MGLAGDLYHQILQGRWFWGTKLLSHGSSSMLLYPERAGGCMDSIPVGLVGVPAGMLSAAVWEDVSPTSLC